MRHPHVVLALAGRTADWPRRVEAWTSGGLVPVRVSHCETSAHLQARLRADGARIALLDGDLPSVDRDLLADVAAVGGVPIVVAGARRRRRWATLGAALVLHADFDREALLDALASVTPPAAGAPSRREAPLLVATGPGGTGASVTAIALAQGLAAGQDGVLLVDGCLHAEQAMLHDADGSHACLADLVDLHTERTPDSRHVRGSAVGIVERGYHLLPGIPRARQWSRIRAGSLQSTLRSLRLAFDVVVVDVDPDVEGEAEGGSIDVEERNVLARTIHAAADVTLVVGQPTMKGSYALVRTMIELLEFGVRPQRLLPVFNGVDAAEAVRAELSRAVRDLIDVVADGGAVGPALFTPHLALDGALRRREALPTPWAGSLAGAAMTVLGRARDAGTATAPAPIAAGSLGHWDDADGGP